MIITDDKDKTIEAYKKEQVEYTNKFIDMQEEIERLKVLVECLYNKVVLNEEQEELLNKVLFGSDKK